MSYYQTIPCASSETGVSEGLIGSAIEQGEIQAWTAAGETVVTIKDVLDYRARLLAGRGCDRCEE